MLFKVFAPPSWCAVQDQTTAFWNLAPTPRSSATLAWGPRPPCYHGLSSTDAWSWWHGFCVGSVLPGSVLSFKQEGHVPGARISWESCVFFRGFSFWLGLLSLCRCFWWRGWCVAQTVWHNCVYIIYHSLLFLYFVLYFSLLIQFNFFFWLCCMYIFTQDSTS